MKKVLTSCLLIIFLLPALAFAVIQDIRIELSYDAPVNKTVVGYNIYQEGTKICTETTTQTGNNIIIGSCSFSSANGTYAFTSTALFSDGSESPHSPPFSYTLNQELTASFTVIPSLLSGIIPFSVTVDPSASKGYIPENNSWSFGDGSAVVFGSGSKSHTFDLAGTYEIQLTVSDGTSTSTKSITVTAESRDSDAPPPTAVINPAAASGGYPFTIYFNSTGSTSGDGGSITSYYWDFGDGAISNMESPAHTFTSPGTYTVLLTVTDNNGNIGTDTSMVIVTDSNIPTTDNFPPVANIYISNYTGYAPMKVTFDASDSYDPEETQLAFTWQFGDGSSSNQPSAVHEYMSEGNYNASLVIGDQQGTTVKKTFTIQVKNEDEMTRLNLSPIYILLLK